MVRDFLSDAPFWDLEFFPKNNKKKEKTKIGLELLNPNP